MKLLCVSLKWTLLCAAILLVAHADLIDDLSAKIEDGFRSFGGASNQILGYFNISSLIHSVHRGLGSGGAQSACRLCKTAMLGIQALPNLQMLASLCKLLRVQTDRVCDGYVASFREEFEIATSRAELTNDEICGILLGDQCHSVAHLPHHTWQIEIPPRKPKSNPRLHHHRKSSKTQQRSKTFKVLQISDIHLDEEYEEGSAAVCTEPLCCRRSSPPKSNLTIHADQAGYWGDYRDCDIPWRTVEQTFRWIRAQHRDLDYVMWTGDIPAHDIWNQTEAGNRRLIQKIDQLIDRYFGHLPIFPVVGNHESFPMNSFPQPAAPVDKIEPKYSKYWLYEALAKHWLRWLPAHTESTIRSGAYYSVRAKPGLRVISVNSNFCNNQNWWLLLNSTDPANQLAWLANQLAEAESRSEAAHILGHVPPGSTDCIPAWSREYSRIISRFAHIIRGQFFGHTHNDEFQLFYDRIRNKRNDDDDHGDDGDDGEERFLPSNIAYIGPSVTTFGNVNPGYRIYTIDADSFELLDHDTYYMNLTEANLRRDQRPIRFEHSYSARKAYGLKSMAPSEWHRLVMRMETYPRDSNAITWERTLDARQIFAKFHQFYFNRADNIGPDNHCADERCKYDYLCRLMAAQSYDRAACLHFLRQVTQ